MASISLISVPILICWVFVLLVLSLFTFVTKFSTNFNHLELSVVALWLDTPVSGIVGNTVFVLSKQLRFISGANH